MLVVTLERNPHISLAHINPESFNQIEAHKEPNTCCTMWFIGLEFSKTENVNIDLTHDIHQFTETVVRQAEKTKMFKLGMKLEARHVRRRELPMYLSPSTIKRERKISSSSGKNGIKRLSDQSDAGTNKRSRLSEEVTDLARTLTRLANLRFQINKDNSNASLSCNDDSNSNISVLDDSADALTTSQQTPDNPPSQTVCT